ncbi:MAG: hypothetical protein GX605_13180, partial [Chloroflexi bacterium]|nr:hypothetical protein [Chloroflexota bacterium]
GPIIAAFTEIIGHRRGSAWHDRLARTVAKFNVAVFSIGALFGVGLVATLVGFWPRLWAQMFNLYLWPMVVEVVNFLLEGITVYAYFYTWNRFRRRKRLHIGIGLLASFFGMVTPLIINGVAASMLTSAGLGEHPFDRSLQGLYLENPTYVALTLHRLVGGLAFMGMCVAAVTAFQAWRLPSGSEKRYFTWATNWTFMIGMVNLFLMPFIGFLYVHDIQQAVLPAFLNLMIGDYRYVFNLQIFFLTLLFAGSNFYLTRLLQSAPAGAGGDATRPALGAVAAGAALALLTAGGLALRGAGPGSAATPADALATLALVAGLYAVVAVLVGRLGRGQWGRVSRVVTLAVLLCTLIAIVPYRQGSITIPIGRMWPWKFATLIGITTLTLANVLIYLRARGHVARELRERFSSTVLMAGALFSLFMMNVMGFAREGARAPFLIYNILRASEEPFETVIRSTTPMPLPNMLGFIVFNSAMVVLLSLVGLWIAFGDSAEAEPPAVASRQ